MNTDNIRTRYRASAARGFVLLALASGGLLAACDDFEDCAVTRTCGSADAGSDARGGASADSGGSGDGGQDAKTSIDAADDVAVDTGPPPCDGDPVRCDGVCKDLTTDLVHCGTCGNVCNDTNASAVACTAGICAPTCNAEFADCNAGANKATDDGCEASLLRPESCGRCERDCYGARCLNAASTEAVTGDPIEQLLCEPAMLIDAVLEGPGEPGLVAALGEDVYFGLYGGDGFYRITVPGGEVTKLGGGQVVATTRGGDRVYWLINTAGYVTLYSAGPTDERGREELTGNVLMDDFALMAYSPSGLALVADARIMWLPLGPGGIISTLIANLAPTSMTILGNRLYTTANWTGVARDLDFTQQPPTVGGTISTPVLENEDTALVLSTESEVYFMSGMTSTIYTTETTVGTCDVWSTGTTEDSIFCMAAGDDFPDDGGELIRGSVERGLEPIARKLKYSKLTIPLIGEPGLAATSSHVAWVNDDTLQFVKYLSSPAPVTNDQ